MKRFAFILLAAQIILAGCDSFRNEIAELHREIDNLKAQVGEINTNIESLNSMISAVQNEDYVKSVIPVILDGDTIGYTINFSKSGSVTIYNGKDGRDGYTPMLGVKNDGDLWYWTIDGNWLLDDSGQKVVANGRDGKDGKNGEDASTPQLKIEDDYWYISYDEGKSWNRLGKSAGSNGKDGENGKDGDSFFASVDTSNPEYITITLTNGTVFKFPTWAAFESLQLIVNSINTNVSALQSIVEVLESQDWVTGVTPLIEDRLVVGYTITFAKADPIVIYNGKDGANGTNGTTPVIGITKREDGLYYWTCNGELIMDPDGKPVKASGISGSNGVTPKFKIENGNWYVSYDNGNTWGIAGPAQGEDGVDGSTPNFKIENGEWYVSYDNGGNWIHIGSATGKDGKDGKDGVTPQFKIEDGYWSVSYDNGITWTRLSSAVGTNGITPMLKIEEDYWYISYDNGETWNKLDKATGNGGGSGVDGFDMIFKKITQDEEFVYITLADGTMITLPKGTSYEDKIIHFEDPYAKLLCISNWDTDYDGELSYKEAAAVTDMRNSFNNFIEGKVNLLFFNELQYFTGISSVSLLSNYPNLYSVVLPKNITSLSGFSSCENLRSIGKIPSKVEVINHGSFKGDIKLRSVEFEANSQLTSIGGGTEYDTGAFEGCTSLRTITLPASLKQLGARAFARCTSLTEVIFEEGSLLEEISHNNAYSGSGAFTGCSMLTSVKFGSDMPPKANLTYVFGNCPKLTTIYVPKGSKSNYSAWNKYTIIEY